VAKVVVGQIALPGEELEKEELAALQRCKEKWAGVRSGELPGCGLAGGGARLNREAGPPLHLEADPPGAQPAMDEREIVANDTGRKADLPPELGSRNRSLALEENGGNGRLAGVERGHSPARALLGLILLREPEGNHLLPAKTAHAITVYYDNLIRIVTLCLRTQTEPRIESREHGTSRAPPPLGLSGSFMP